MSETRRRRTRALIIVGMAAVTTAIGAVGYQASAAEVAAPAVAAPPVDARAPGARAVAIPGIPAAIQPPAGSRPIGAYIVTTGVQTYACVNGTYATSSVPEAQLVGTGGRIHHFAGPSWQSERDGSLVTAKKLKDSPRAGTIPELLLEVTSHTGRGILDKADYINRLYTSGGVGPTGACQADAAVPYGAVYVFWDAPA
jgi:Protein of unknown function (DUF3455)